MTTIAGKQSGQMMFLVVCISLLGAAGCSRYREDKWSRQWPLRHPVGGLVTLKGNPVSSAVVTFVVRLPESEGRVFTAVGMTDTAGRFTLTTFRPSDGAVAGAHTVTIEKSAFKDGAVVHELPRKYARQDTSGLTAEVTAKGQNEFIFNLDDVGSPSKATR